MYQSSNLRFVQKKGKKKKKNLLATKILAKNISMYQSLNLKFVQENKIKKRKKKRIVLGPFLQPEAPQK